MSDLIGQTIGNYRVEALIGSGGMAQVYRAVHVNLNRPAAIKVMHANLAADPKFQERFKQEAKAAAQLSHPNIIAIHDFTEQERDGLLYLVMEYIDGRVGAHAAPAIGRRDAALPPARHRSCPAGGQRARLRA